jgi:hypothetical protein
LVIINQIIGFDEAAFPTDTGAGGNKTVFGSFLIID